MIFDEREREELSSAGVLPHPEVQSKALVVRRNNYPAVVPRQSPSPVEEAATRSVVELSAAAVTEAQRLTQLQATLAAMCADHQAQGTCPGHCVRGGFG